MRVDGILFDFDHTLVDSPIDFGAMRRGVYELLDTRGLVVPERDQKLILEVAEEAAAALPRAEADRLRAAAAEHILALELTAAKEAVVLPGVPEAMARLRAEGRKLAIITRNCRQVIDQVMETIELPADQVLCRDEVPRVKPDPGHAEQALRAIGVGRERAILVGDFRGDIDCAIRAGLLGIGVTTGSTSAEALREAGAAYVLASVAELPDWLAARRW